MLTAQERQAVADALLQADATRQVIPQPSRTWPAMEIDDACAIQSLWAQARIARGARVIGHKIGLTSRAMQKASKMTEPDYGVMLDDALFRDGASIAARRFIRPRLEIEESGVPAAVMGHPASGVAWLVRMLHGVGARLERGHIVLAGSFTRPVDIAAGDIVTADYGPLGSVSLSFAWGEVACRWCRPHPPQRGSGTSRPTRWAAPTSPAS